MQTSLIRYRSATVAQICFAVFAVVFDFAAHANRLNFNLVVMRKWANAMQPWASFAMFVARAFGAMV